MPYLLKHHFDPDWDPAKLRPALQADGSVDHHELNFVNNVHAGDLIAEWIEPDDADGNVEDRFLVEEKVFPAGKGTGLKRNSPDKLFAAVDGYACYIGDKIVVRHTLTIHGDVDYRTGNIEFVGNVVIEGCVRSGFSVKGLNVHVDGQIEGAQVTALADLEGQGGVKGGKEAYLEAGGAMRLAFCEYGTLQCEGDLMIKGALMHSTVYAGNSLAVGDRMTGGNYHSYRFIYVGGQLGGGLDTDTALILGYKPPLLHADAKYKIRIKKLLEKISSYEMALNKGDEYKAELEPKLEAARREMQLIKELRIKLWEGIVASERLNECRVLAPNVIKPGVEISIGSAYSKVDDYLENVVFYHENDEIKVGAPTDKVKR